jgi:16S rRNA G1207 methylase RsmC
MIMSDPKNMQTLQFEVYNESFVVKRYPYSTNSDLRAWDSADSYLLNTLQSLLDLDGALPCLSSLCILNDNFGALTIPLATYQPVCYGDSWMSREAIEQNLKLNDSDLQLDFQADFDCLIDSYRPPSYVIGRVPKSKSQFAYMLQCLNTWLDEGAILLLAGMDKHLSKGQYELIGKYFGEPSFLPGVKKARVWQAVVNKNLPEPAFKHKKVSIPEFSLTLTALANVFSADKLDIGTRFFLENFSKLPQQERVADLACGNGVLGLAYLSLYPDTRLLFRDESYQAIQSTQQNLKFNFPDLNADLKTDDGFKSTASESLDLVLCNPPFHQQNLVSTDIANTLFKETHRVLRSEGELWVIANRHLGYHVSLKRIFGSCDTVASNPKFVILKVVK